MQLLPKQLWSINRSTARLNLWEGAVRSGKTIATDHRYLQKIKIPKVGLPPDAIDVIVGKTTKALERNIINPLVNLLGNEARYFPGKQKLQIWDNEIDIVGANDERSVGKIQGSTIRYVLGDEVALWPESFFTMLDTRLSLDCSQGLFTTNPGPPNHWLKKNYIDRRKDLDFKCFHFTLDDNTSLSEKYTRALKNNFTGLWYKRLILGLWCVAEGAIFDFFNEEEHTLLRYPKAEYYILSIDYGTSNPFAALLMGVNRNTKPKIWVEREFYYDGKKEQKQKTDGEYSVDLKAWIVGIFGRYWRNFVRTVYLDPSAESFEVQLNKDGFMGVTHADNAVEDGLRVTASMLKTGDYAISACCKHYIEEMYSYVWDEKAQEKGEDKPKKENDHCQDAGRYGVNSEFGGEALDYNILGAY